MNIEVMFALDEVEDGIAACAKEQAVLWAAAAKEGNCLFKVLCCCRTYCDLDPANQVTNTAFVEEILQMTNAYGGNGHRQGAFGTSTRLQPRFVSGKQYEYDSSMLSYFILLFFSCFV
jgi:hypothetical protein